MGPYPEMLRNSGLKYTESSLNANLINKNGALKYREIVSHAKLIRVQ